MSIRESIVKSVKQCVFECEKHSPEILFVAGCVGVVGAVALAIKAGPKVKGTIMFHRGAMHSINTTDPAEMDEGYSKRRDKFETYVDTGVDLAKAVAPAALVGTAAIACFAASNHIINQRYIGAVAWGTGVADAFAAYRGRVKEELGDDMDQHFRYGTKLAVRHDVVNENGEAYDVTSYDSVDENEPTEVGDLNPKDLARYFDETNDNWDNNPTFNLMFLRAQEKLANDKFHGDGHLVLNEVYDMLGFKHTPLGAVAGWIEGEDECVDFGLGRRDAEGVRQFINGNKAVVPLEFNCRHVIWDKI